MSMHRNLAALALWIALAAPALASDPVKVVAAENFYGDVAKQIGGAHVDVVSILSNPDQDPHLFEASAQTARAVAEAKLVIANGVDYDPWMQKLLDAHKTSGRVEIVVGALAERKAGDNPHLWYRPDYMKLAAEAIAARLEALDPADKGDYEKGAEAFTNSLLPLEAKIAAMRAKYAGWPITASEPVFGYQAEAIGLDVRNAKFALAVMNGAEPAASEVANFENDLKSRKVKAMIYNAQASEPAVRRLLQMARDNSVPVVGVSETEPPVTTYQNWMLSQLEALDAALAGGAK